MLTDTHVHIDGLLRDGTTLPDVLAAARAAGVGRMLAVGGAPAGNRTALEAARLSAGWVRAAVGYDRSAGTEPDWQELAACLDQPEVAALGEVGLDFYRDPGTASGQQALLRRQLNLAVEHELPVCVHTRAADSETLAALRQHAAAWHGAPRRIGVMHCFTGSLAFARDLLELGFCLSFSGIVSFRKSHELRAVAAAVPAEQLLIETDSPYLAPEPFRGRPCEPALVRWVAEALAAARGTDWQEIAAITTRNAVRLFWPAADRE